MVFVGLLVARAQARKSCHLANAYRYVRERKSLAGAMPNGPPSRYYKLCMRDGKGQVTQCSAGGITLAMWPFAHTSDHLHRFGRRDPNQTSARFGLYGWKADAWIAVDPGLIVGRVSGGREPCRYTILPGFMIPVGSSAPLINRTPRRQHCHEMRFASPIPCSPVQVLPIASARSATRSTNAFCARNLFAVLHHDHHHGGESCRRRHGRRSGRSIRCAERPLGSRSHNRQDEISARKHRLKRHGHPAGTSRPRTRHAVPAIAAFALRVSWPKRKTASEFTRNLSEAL